MQIIVIIFFVIILFIFLFLSLSSDEDDEDQKRISNKDKDFLWMQHSIRRSTKYTHMSCMHRYARIITSVK